VTKLYQESRTRQVFRQIPSSHEIRDSKIGDDELMNRVVLPPWDRPPLIGLPLFDLGGANG
jgi:hypothetical protein